MFKRIIVEDWVHILPIISFGLTFGVFAVMFVRAFIMKKEEVEHLATLPLEDESSPLN